MTVAARVGMKAMVAGLAITMVACLAGCGGGGGEPPSVQTSPPPGTLPLMVDSLGRAVPEAEFGRGDPQAAGADGIAFDGGPIANAQVTLADNGGSTRVATTDASGYYRIDIRDLRLPFILRVMRPDGTQWFSAGTQLAVTRGFVPININGVTDKSLGYVADGLNLGSGAASAVTPALLAANRMAFDGARYRLIVGLSAPLTTAGLDPATYEPIAGALPATSVARHSAFLRSLVIRKNAQGRTVIVGTVAGTPATLSRPGAVAVDAGGNVYVADTNNSVIRKITPDGQASTLAGSGSVGFADGPGIASAFNFPAGVAVDDSGNVYVADQYNHAIRKISATGVVATLAGGDVVPGTADGTGLAARFSYPQALAVDAAGNVYVPDALHSTIRKVTPAGVVTTITGASASGSAGNSSSSFHAPGAIAVDGAGNLYIGQAPGEVPGAIFKLTPAGAVTTLYVHRDPSTGFYPFGIAVGPAGSLYVADAVDNRVLKLSSDGVLTTLAGDGGFRGEPGWTDASGAAARFATPMGLAADAAGTLFVADASNNAIRKVTPAGGVTTFAGRRTGYVDGAGAAAMFNNPAGVAVDFAGNILVADTGNHTVRKIARTGFVTTVAGNGTAGYVNGAAASATFRAPQGVAVGGGGDVFVADTFNQAIRKISPGGNVSTFAGSTDPSLSSAYGFVDGPGLVARFKQPSSIAADRVGNLYVTDFFNDTVRKIDLAVFVTAFAGGGPVNGLTDAELVAQGFSRVNRAIAVDAGGSVYFPAGVPDRNSSVQRIVSVSSAGALVSRSALYSDFRQAGLAVDVQGNVFYGRDKAIFRVTPQGVETEVAASGVAYVDSSRFAVDRDGNLIVSDTANSGIRIVLP